MVARTLEHVLLGGGLVGRSKRVHSDAQLQYKDNRHFFSLSQTWEAELLNAVVVEIEMDNVENRSTCSDHIGIATGMGRDHDDMTVVEDSESEASTVISSPFMVSRLHMLNVKDTPAKLREPSGMSYVDPLASPVVPVIRNLLKPDCRQSEANQKEAESRSNRQAHQAEADSDDNSQVSSILVPLVDNSMAQTLSNFNKVMAENSPHTSKEWKDNQSQTLKEQQGSPSHPSSSCIQDGSPLSLKSDIQEQGAPFKQITVGQGQADFTLGCGASASGLPREIQANIQSSSATELDQGMDSDDTTSITSAPVMPVLKTSGVHIPELFRTEETGSENSHAFDGTRPDYQELLETVSEVDKPPSTSEKVEALDMDQSQSTQSVPTGSGSQITGEQAIAIEMLGYSPKARDMTAAHGTKGKLTTDCNQQQAHDASSQTASMEANTDLEQEQESSQSLVHQEDLETVPEVVQPLRRTSRIRKSPGFQTEFEWYSGGETATRPVPPLAAAKGAGPKLDTSHQEEIHLLDEVENQLHKAESLLGCGNRGSLKQTLATVEPLLRHLNQRHSRERELITAGLTRKNLGRQEKSKLSRQAGLLTGKQKRLVTFFREHSRLSGFVSQSGKGSSSKSVTFKPDGQAEGSPGSTLGPTTATRPAGRSSVDGDSMEINPSNCTSVGGPTTAFLQPRGSNAGMGPKARSPLTKAGSPITKAGSPLTKAGSPLTGATLNSKRSFPHATVKSQRAVPLASCSDGSPAPEMIRAENGNVSFAHGSKSKDETGASSGRENQSKGRQEEELAVKKVKFPSPFTYGSILTFPGKAFASQTLDKVSAISSDTAPGSVGKALSDGSPTQARSVAPAVKSPRVGGPGAWPDGFHSSPASVQLFAATMPRVPVTWKATSKGLLPATTASSVTVTDVVATTPAVSPDRVTRPPDLELSLTLSPEVATGNMSTYAESAMSEDIIASSQMTASVAGPTLNITEVFQASKKSVMRKPQQQLPDLKELLASGVMQPGENVLSLHTPKKTFFASLLPTGLLQDSGGGIFHTVLGWCTAITSSIGTPLRKSSACQKVMYRGKPLSDLVVGVPAKKCRVGDPAVRPAAQREGKPRRPEKALAKEVLPPAALASPFSEAGLARMLSHCSINLIGDSELTPSEDLLPRNFWAAASFENVELPHWLVDCVDKW